MPPNACPPQFRPDSTRYSLTHNPCLARSLPWSRADRKSLTFRTMHLRISPASSGKKSAKSARWEKSFRFMPADRTTEDRKRLLA